MAYFPQLGSGAAGQFPVSRTVKKRTIRTESAEGRECKTVDAGWQEVEWVMTLGGLAEQERTALERFFEEVEGRLGSFTFLDPMGNLLSWSEELWREAWTRGPHIQLNPEVGDPFGTRRAVGVWNNSAVPERLEQALGVPGWFQYCLSLWMRSGEPTEATLFGRAGGGAQALTVKVERTWRRVAWPVRLECEDELVRFGVELGPGVSVELFGMQVEAQAGASKYKRTGMRGGIYPEARFGQDVLAVRAEGAGVYSCGVRVVARL